MHGECFEASDVDQDAILLVKRKRAQEESTAVQVANVKKQVNCEKLLKERDTHVGADAESYRAGVLADA